MSMRHLLLPLCLLSALPAAGQDGPGGRAELSFGLFAGDGLSVGTADTRFDAVLGLGRTGIQIGAESSALVHSEGPSDADAAVDALRLILWRDMTDRLRLGFSATLTGGDDPAAGYPALGLHALHEGIGFRIEGDIVKPLDDDATNGVLVARLRLEQDFGDRFTLGTTLYRRSTDSEGDDLFAILLRGRYEIGPATALFAEAFHTGRDDATLESTGLHAGLARAWGEGGEVFAAVTAKDGTTGPAAGLTLGLRLNWGAETRLFSPGPLPSYGGFGAW